MGKSPIIQHSIKPSECSKQNLFSSNLFTSNSLGRLVLMVIPPFQTTKFASTLFVDGQPGAGDLPPLQSIEPSGASVFRIIFPLYLILILLIVFPTSLF